MVRHLITLAPLALLVACGGADPDEDGLTNAEERDFGSDPKMADSDGDGLPDGDEFAAGTDPMLDDSDGDGMLDGDEVLYGRDPLDRKSREYKGKWPMQTVAIKEEIESGKRSKSAIQVGTRFPRLTLRDQNGDKVDLYDFAGHGKPVLIDLSAFNCGPCLNTATWLSSDTPAADYWGAPGLEELDIIRDAVNNGEAYWLTFVYSSYYDPSESEKGMAEMWDEEYPNHMVPVFEDTKMAVWDFAWTAGMPAFARLNDKMIVKEYELGMIASNSDGSDAFPGTLMQSLIDELK